MPDYLVDDNPAPSLFASGTRADAAGGEGSQPPAAAVSGSAASPIGITGLKLTKHFPGVDWCVQVHWLRVVRPIIDRETMTAWLTSLFGDPEPMTKGKWSYDAGLRFQNSVLLLWKEGIEPDHDSGLCVDVPGSVFDAIESIYECFEFGQRLTLGGRVTRIDLALDGIDDKAVGLIDRVHQACSDGALVGARRWQSIVQHDSGALRGRGVTIGARGKDGSGRYARCYDKGLESKERPAGTHERYEVEFCKDCATQVAVAVFASVHTFEKAILERILGAFDFREPKEREGQTHLNRRKRLDWWQALNDGICAIRTVLQRTKTTYGRYVSWLKRSVLPCVKAIADKAGLHMLDVVYSCVGEDVKPTRDAPKVRNFAREFERTHGAIGRLAIWC